MVEWLSVPIDATRAHDVNFYQAWHGRLMVLAWAILFPVGVLAARFFKVLPRQDWPTQLDNPLWWHTHRATQYLGGVAVLAAMLLLAIAPKGAEVTPTHTQLGWTVIVICVVQFISAWLRGTKGGPTAPAPDGSLSGDHFDMTVRRRLFEYVHKILGYIVIVIAFGATVSGLWSANAAVWMWCLIVLWWVAISFIFIVLQTQRGAFDTYQAIWGPDQELPGNRATPIGLGISRCEKDK
ncbi:MAG: cytochrome b561 domain-containing protein [Hyphomicrobiaceae bacterium]